MTQNWMGGIKNLNFLTNKVGTTGGKAMKNIITLLVLLVIVLSLSNFLTAQEPISQEDVDILLGKWTGDAPLGDDLLRLAFRFEATDDGKFAALIDMPDGDITAYRSPMFK